MPFLRSRTLAHRKEDSRPAHCLNCSKAVSQEHVFCGHCGQENEPSPVSFVALLREGWEEFVKIDTKLLRTILLLLFRPGYLSGEYVVGRRTAYLSPFKMYITVSAVFFLIFSLLIPFDNLPGLNNAAKQADTKIAAESQSRNKAPKPPTPSGKNQLHLLTRDEKTGKPAEKADSPTTFWQEARSRPLSIFGTQFLLNSLPATVDKYREDQLKKRANDRDNPTLHYMTERVIRFRNDPGDTLKSMLSTGLPLLMLIQLPLFSIWMRLIYFRQRRLYVEHLLFLLHTHTFFFLLFGVLLGAETAAHSMGQTLTWLESNKTPWLVLTGTVALYNLLALKRFYGQDWGKTIVKSWFLLSGYLFLLGFSIGLALAISLLWTLFAPG